MSLLSEQEFLARYSVSELLGKGTYGKVYDSGDFAVKVQKLDSNFFTELCVMAQFRHPNICPIVDFAISDDKGYLAMPRGIDLLEAFNDGKITVREILSDLFAGMYFLNSHGIAHADLKVGNCIFLNGRVQIIDFGMVYFCQRADVKGKDYFFKGLAYTPGFKDPEYEEDRPNTIKVELYTIWTTLYYLLYPHHRVGKEKVYYLDVAGWEKLNLEPDMIDLLMKCQAPLNVRQSIEELIDYPALIQDRINRSEIALIQNYHVKEILDFQGYHYNMLNIVFGWLWEINMSSPETHFLTCDLMSRFLAKEQVPRKYLQLLAVGCYYLSRAVLGYNQSIEELLHISADQYTHSEFMEMIGNVLRVLKAEIWSRTIYETLYTVKTLVFTMMFIARPEYGAGFSYDFSHHVPELVISEKDSFSGRMVPHDFTKYKFVATKKELEPVYFPRKTLFSDTPIFRLIKASIITSNTYHSAEKFYDDYICYIVRNMDILSNLKPKVAHAFFQRLYRNAVHSKSFYLMDHVFGCQIRLKDDEMDQPEMLKKNVFVHFREIFNLSKENVLVSKTTARLQHRLQTLHIALPEITTFKIIDKSRKRKHRLFLSNYRITTADKADAVEKFMKDMTPPSMEKTSWEKQETIILKYNNDLQAWIESFFDPKSCQICYLEKC